MSKEKQSAYLKDLMHQHTGSAHQIGKIIENAQEHYQIQIIKGKYQIKKGIPFKTETQSNKNKPYNIIKTKRQLQQQLELIQDKLGNLTQRDEHTGKLSDQQHKKFMKQMIRQRKQTEMKRLKQIRQAEEKQEQQKKLSQEKINREEEQKKEKRRKQLQQKQIQMKSARQRKKIENKSQNQILFKKMKEKLLADKMGEKFYQSQAYTLQQRKKKLAEIRSLHKPLSKEEFQSHLNKIKGLKDQIKSQGNQGIPTNKTNFYKSSWYKSLSKQQKKSLDKLDLQQLQQMKQMKDKQKKYALYVRQNFKPEIDEKKASQLKEKNPSNISTVSLKNQQIRQIGLKYLKISKELADHKKKQDAETDKNITDNLPPRYKQINYLEQLKKNKKVSASSHDFVESLKKKNNLSSSEKAQKIIQFAERLQKKAKKKEQLDKANKNVIDQQLDQLYIEAIEAKLSLLDKDIQ